IIEGGRWIRLNPIPYRFHAQENRFRKYQYIEAEVTKATSDPRPESYNVNLDSIKPLSAPLPADNKWEARKAKVFPLRSQSLCALMAERDLHQHPTLGFFKPKAITRLRIDETSPEWTETELTKLRQYTMFSTAPKRELEKLPCTFTYEFTCDDLNCGSHSLSCTDWEMGQSYRKWKEQYGTEWEQKFRHKFETEMIERLDTHFYVGTIRHHPATWIIIGLFYPPK
ncbi:MAG: hypothetical protein Q8O76_03590, partial [Chloroflexota bacterium]|nr:hypothetical protein [Chloroflexota bacterium]